MAKEKKVNKRIQFNSYNVCSDLLWNTNEEENMKALADFKGLKLKTLEVDFSDLPTPSPDFDMTEEFQEIIMEADRVIYEIRDAIIAKFVQAAIARGVSRQTARRFIEKSWKVV